MKDPTMLSMKLQKQFKSLKIKTIKKKRAKPSSKRDGNSSSVSKTGLSFQKPTTRSSQTM